MGYSKAEGLCPTVINHPDLIDFRSDTVTRPSNGMITAMNEALVGDDVYGEDVTVHELENRVADLFGFESALFCTTGTLSNQIALFTHLDPLSAVLCDERSHIHTWETGGIHVHSRASVQSVTPSDPELGFLTRKDVEDALNTGLDHNLYHNPITTTVSLENTMAGKVHPQHHIEEISALARSKGLGMHLDGARIWNAIVKTGQPASDYGKHFDTISVCLSKGLGAPIGSVMLGSEERVLKGRHVRKLMGGGWRQAGVIAAAGLYAIDHQWERMAEDHQNAVELNEGMREIGFETQPSVTNMVFADSRPLGVTFDQLAGPLSQEKILIAPSGHTTRLVLHMDVDRKAIQRLLGGFKRALTLIKK
eukprot:GFYU01007360.1.p1 GENE.GFYU01007360.1~~GFYU01007360.1.p1  ORF type:complete len:364 (+),score=81.21 GFYU01007360.1:52-1143(+)